MYQTSQTHIHTKREQFTIQGNDYNVFTGIATGGMLRGIRVIIDVNGLSIRDYSPEECELIYDRIDV